jgi:hypothetical protein
MIRSWLPALSIALAAWTLAQTPPAHAYAVVQSTCQACTGSGAGECETALTVVGAGQTANMSRFWNFTAFTYLTDTNMTLDYISLSAFARASGTENPDSGTTFLNGVTRIARSIGGIGDVLTAGEGGAPGFFRIPLHVTGGSAISWQNGSGSASLVFQCVSSEPGSPFAIGQCPIAQYNFTGDEIFDQEVVLDVPIVLGEPFQYQLTISVQAQTGHAYGDLVPFTGAAQASFASQPFAGASVLDANHVVIPDAPISASESGFSYAPEPSSTASAALAIATVSLLRRRA